MTWDFGKTIGADMRQVIDKDYEGQPARAVIGIRTYPTSAQDLWDALTNAERLPRWFAPVDGDLRLGGRFQIKGNAAGTIKRCEPPSALDVTWEMMGGMSWVMLRLDPEGEGTRLTLEHIVHLKDIPEEHWQKFGPGAVGVGWDLSFLGLGLHIESGGAAKPPETDTEWVASDQAKTFMRNSARAWAEADITNGEDPMAARERADRTIAAYTGG